MIVKSNVTKSGTAPDTYAASYIDAGYQARYVMITIWDNSALITLTWDANYAGDEVELDPGTYSLSIECRGFKIKNKTAGSNARYQVVFFHSAGFTA